MTIEPKDGKVVLEAVQTAVNRYGASHDELIPILTDVNRAIGYLPGEALGEISRLLKVPRSQLFSVASFYRMLSTKPRGKHVLQFCESAPCHVAGGREVWMAIKEALNIEENQTTPDGKWTLIATSCLGVCGVGPVMIIDDEVIGNVDPKEVPTILARYQ